jgi:SAM-dependent methyltransferase
MLPVQRASGRFWESFNFDGCPDFAGLTILEIGSGLGDRCFEAANSGALRVVGVEPSSLSFKSSQLRLDESSSDLQRKIEFFEGVLSDLPKEKFDVVISENTFEHVVDVSGLLDEIARRLNAGGRFYLAFGPLYNAPDGDHGWLRNVLPGRRYFSWPWGHLIFKRYAFRKLSQLHGELVTGTINWPYLSLNQHTPAEYKEMFRKSGLRITYFRTNNVKSLKGKLFAPLSRIPALSSYFTINMHAILEPAESVEACHMQSNSHLR